VVVTIESAPTAQGWDCDVEVAHDGRSSRYNVRVSRQDLERWGSPGEADPDALVRRTFDFLLRREAPEQILKSFELRDVSRYFPEFDEEMRPR
jgi:hypothetical protein